MPLSFHPKMSAASCALLQSMPFGNMKAASSSCENINFHNTSALLPLVHRLDSLLMVLKTCVGRQCTHPWESLFPLGEVFSLSQALNPKYDDFFEERVERVRYSKCERGYIADSEGPMWSSEQAYAMTEEMAYE